MYGGEALAQSDTRLQAEVFDQVTGEPLPYTSASLLRLPDSTVRYYAFTDEQGHFELPFPQDPERYVLVIQAFGYAYLFSPLVALSPDTLYRIELQPLQTQLEEVTIRARQPIRRRGDTLNYQLAPFIDSTEVTVGDVLAKLPGSEVSN